VADFDNLSGTSESSFQVGLDGPLLKRNGTALEVRDAADTVFATFRVADGSGASDALSRGAHEALDSLVHELAETSYEEVTRLGGLVTDVIVWTDSGKTIKVREMNLTRASGRVSVIVRKQYNAGVLVQTMTSTITRSGGHVASIDHVET